MIAKENSHPLPDDADWNFADLERYEQEIARVAKEYGLDTYPNQIEMISSEQMMDAYASFGMPISYHHWSYGKKFIQTQQNYRRGQMGLAYEIVINSNPCIAYLMEENTMTMQALVMAHACYGHNSFFKGNYLFKTWTDADSIIDYLLFAQKYIRKCEEKYGISEVESTLDACHALLNHGVDRYKRPQKLSLQEEEERLAEREKYLQANVDALWQRFEKVKYSNKNSSTEQEDNQLLNHQEPQENLLYFFEKNAPLLEPWQREIVRIVRKIGQYFYPQRQTQVMNEGWACFWHYTLLNTLYDQGLLTDKFMLEFLHHHSNVIIQPPYNSPYYSGINPYALGFNMFCDIRRICESPTEEDKQWFPEIAGSNWQETLTFAMQNFKDESFISQYLSPHLMREFKLFQIQDDKSKDHYQVQAIHNEQGYKQIRAKLAKQYDLGYVEPNIQITKADIKGDRSLTLEYFSQNNVPLNNETKEVLKHIHYLWQFKVKLVEQCKPGNYKVIAECPEQKSDSSNG